MPCPLLYRRRVGSSGTLHFFTRQRGLPLNPSLEALYFFTRLWWLPLNPSPLKPRGLLLCPGRQSNQNALGWVPSVRSGGKFFRLYICGVSKSGVCSHCSLCEETATLRKNLHYYLGASQLLGCVKSALRINSASPSARPVISLAFVMVSFTRLPFGNGQPTFADRSSGGFSHS